MASSSRRLTTTWVLLAATLLVPARAQGGPGAPPCTTLGTSLTFATDRTMFCGTEASQPADSGNYLDVYRSVDAGRTWAGPFHVVDAGKGAAGVVSIYVSPNYQVDRTLFVGTSLGGYVSTDGGVTFTLLSGMPFAREVTTVYLGKPPHSSMPYPSLITIPLTTEPGPCCPRVFDWLTPQSRPVPPNYVNWVFARHYIVPPNFFESPLAVMVGRPGVWGPNDPVPLESGHAKAYSCDAAFNCLHEIYDFAPPPGMTDTRIRFTGSTYSGSPDTYVVTYSDPERPSVQVFRSPDRGLTWTPWTSVNKLVAGLPWRTKVMVAASPDAPKRLFLVIRADDSGLTQVPDQRLLRSDDNGVTWRQIGHAWGPTQHARSKSTLPWNSGGYAWQPFVVAPGGRLLVPAARRIGGWQTIGRQAYMDMFCSRDYGRSWLRRC